MLPERDCRRSCNRLQAVLTGRLPGAERERAWQLPSTRRVARLLMADTATLDETGQVFTARLLTKEPVLRCPCAGQAEQ